jgi:DNA-binding response OmpR family regulator
MAMNAPAHILVVEDEEHLAAGIRYNLTAEGYRVTAVGDGPAALRIFRENPRTVDLVILDLMLPGMSGYAVCEAIRESDVEIPILILTARTLTEDRTRGFEVGANQYLTKPFDLDEFLVRIKNLLTLHGRDKPKPGAAAVTRFAFADAQIDFESFDVVVRGDPVRMTQLEMALLRYFIEHEGRVIPRAELLEKIWGLPGNLNTRAPDQFIRRLRKIFEPNPARPVHFLTFRDSGYRFVARPGEGEKKDEG